MAQHPHQTTAKQTHQAVWGSVEIHLELAQEFDPFQLHSTHPGLALVMAELLLGSPRRLRDPAELALWAGCTSFEREFGQLRLVFPELRRLGLLLDRLFDAISFDVIGQPLTYRNVAASAPKHTLATPLWLCHRPLEAMVSPEQS
jgi:hypothetical protein